MPVLACAAVLCWEGRDVSLPASSVCVSVRTCLTCSLSLLSRWFSCSATAVTAAAALPPPPPLSHTNKHQHHQTNPTQEYCDCGTLASVATEWKHEPESDSKMLERLQLLQDCAKGLKELHSRNVVHGDLVSR